ncbi:hypothetical protein [Pseudonocardia spinosispora]|nr:hypothetical protein [Pseudonocardia spinosispora]
MGKHDQQAEKDDQWLGEELLTDTGKADEDHSGKHRRTDSSGDRKD